MPTVPLNKRIMLRAHAAKNSKTERGGLNFVDPEISINLGLG